MSDTLSAVAGSSSLHTHDYLLLLFVLAGVVIVYRFFVAHTRDRRSKIDAQDLFLDDTTRRLSWSKTMGAIGVGFLGAVLMQQALAGKPLDTLYGIFATAIIAPIIMRIFKGGEAVSPAQYANPVPTPPPAPAPVAVSTGTTNITTGGSNP